MPVPVRAVAAGAAVYAAGTYLAVAYLGGGRGDEAADGAAGGEDVDLAAVWEQMGDYDAQTATDELLMGMPLARWWLMRRARGAVLEVSVGTARNLGYLPRDAVERVVLTDGSESMLALAARKAATEASGLAVATAVADAQALPFEDESFDTVIDSFGLCSCQDPQRMLRELARVCKRDGSVLLLEHGRGYEFINRVLDRSARKHALRWGCWWNRDIGALVTAPDSGLVIESHSTLHFGTTHMIVARPR